MTNTSEHHQSHYETVSVAINELKTRGYTSDFRAERGLLVCQEGEFQSQELEIVDVYRYEGNTDPADEAVVYAIECANGVKGVLVAGYGVSADDGTAQIIRKIPIRSK